jgi:molybdate transport system substrate-binding protein
VREQARRGPRWRLGALGLSVALAACGGGGSSGTTLTVFAAASLTDAFTAIGDGFEADHDDVTVRFSFAGSTSLREQVLAGAPADVLASADEASMAAVVDAGATAGPARVFARNRLALVTPAGNPAGVRGLDDLARPDLLVGLCAPQVPCGALARTLLRDASVAAEADTEEPDVRALLTKLVGGDLDVGLVYETDALAAGDDVDRLPLPGDGPVTDYVVAVVADGDRALAEAFLDHLTSPDGQRVLTDEGFLVP